MIDRLSLYKMIFKVPHPGKKIRFVQIKQVFALFHRPTLIDLEQDFFCPSDSI